MSDIRERIGGSKATLYNYFPSKEKLFSRSCTRLRSLSWKRSQRK